MIDPLTIFMVGAGALAFRELNRKDYGILTPARDERYRNAMEHCHNPEVLLAEAKLFADHGLKAQAAMLKRRAEWRSRPEEVRQQHEDIFQKALKSENIQGIVIVANAFEGWTATKKAATLRERVRTLQEATAKEVVQKAAAEATKEVKHANGNGIPRNTENQSGIKDTQQVIGDDT